MDLFGVFLLAMAILALVALLLQRPRKHLLILLPVAAFFLVSAICYAFWSALGLGRDGAQIALEGYILSSFLGMLLDRWLLHQAARRGRS